MTADELRRMREELALSLEDVAQVSGLQLDQLREWNRVGRLPRRAASKIERGVWELRSTRALEAARVPRCAWVEGFKDWKDQKRVAELEKHVADCEVCQRRIAVLEREVGPPPVTGGILERLLAYDERLGGWRHAAYRGALTVLALGGIGGVVLLVVAVFRMDLFLATLAGVLLVVMAASGGIGGLVFYWTRSWRGRGAIPHYASTTMTVCVYALAAVGLLWVGMTLMGVDLSPAEFGGREGRAASLAFAGVSLLFGLVLGRMARKDTTRGPT